MIYQIWYIDGISESTLIPKDHPQYEQLTRRQKLIMEFEVNSVEEVNGKYEEWKAKLFDAPQKEFDKLCDDLKKKYNLTRFEEKIILDFGDGLSHLAFTAANECMGSDSLESRKRVLVIADCILATALALSNIASEKAISLREKYDETGSM